MEGILHTFGIDARLIVIQVVNFALLLAALWYFLYTPILTMLREREEKITQGLHDAEAAHAEKEAAQTEKQKMLSAAHKEAEEIANRAKAFADEKISSMLENAQQKAAIALKDAEAKGEELKQKAQKESEAEIARLAILAAEKVLREK